MSARFAKSALVAAAVAGAMAAVPAAASAQSYGYNNGYYNNGYGQSYDRCQTYSDGRTGAGALIGGGIGAVAGSQIAARGRRTEGSIIGGVLGAVIGAQVGRASNDGCRTDNRYNNAYSSSQYRGTTYSPAQTYYYSNDRYDDRAYYGNRYDDRRYDNRYDNGRRYENGYEISADGYYYFDPRRGWLPR